MPQLMPDRQFSALRQPRRVRHLTFRAVGELAGHAVYRLDRIGEGFRALSWRAEQLETIAVKRGRSPRAKQGPQDA